MAGGAVALGAHPAQAAATRRCRAPTRSRRCKRCAASIDRTLALIKEGKSDQAFEEAKDGYLNHFELVEIPLRVADNSLTIHAESLFAEIRTMIRNDDSEGEIRDKIVELRGVMDDVERKLTSTGLTAPALVLGQSFLIIFREGFEVDPAAERAARLPRGGEVAAVHAADPRRASASRRSRPCSR